MEQDKTIEEAETQRRLKRALDVAGRSPQPLYPQVPAPIHELGEMANKAKRRALTAEQLKPHRERLERFGQRIEEVAKRALRREKIIHSLKRRHWEAILEMAREHLEPESTQCFGTYGSGKECSVWLKKQDPLCQACMIVTKLMEVLDE